jgi:hypothetical protein
MKMVLNSLEYCGSEIFSLIDEKINEMNIEKTV